MIDTPRPLFWKEIVRERSPEELPFLHFFAEIEDSQAPAEG